MANLFIISAPSGCGKTSLVKALIQSIKQLSVCVSHTTRAPRPGEKNGKNYFFVSAEEFSAIQNNNGFIEHAFVFNNNYGSSKQTVQDLFNQQQDVILEIDWQGAAQVKLNFPDAISIFILPPSNNALRQRLIGRKQDSNTVIEQRMQQAKNEIQHFDEYDYLVINDDFELALTDLKTIIKAQRLRLTPQTKTYQNLLKQLI